MSWPRLARVISAMSEFGLLRPPLTAMAIAAAGVGIAAPVAAAHHGDTGEYDITRPLFVSGEVLEAQYGYPHAVLRLRISPDEEVPGDLGRYERLAEIDEAPALADLRVPEAGELEVLLPPTITADTADPRSGRPDVGETLEGIFLARCPQNGQYDREIRAVALSLADNEVSLRPDSDPTGYREGCSGDAPAAGVDEQARPPSPAEADDGGPSLLLYAGVAALGLGVLAALVGAVAGRRKG